jgi:hypothetical protein
MMVSVACFVSSRSVMIIVALVPFLKSLVLITLVHEQSDFVPLAFAPSFVVRMRVERKNRWYRDLVHHQLLIHFTVLWLIAGNLGRPYHELVRRGKVK